MNWAHSVFVHGHKHPFGIKIRTTGADHQKTSDSNLDGQIQQRLQIIIPAKA
jgi:hypothetical protein